MLTPHTTWLTPNRRLSASLLKQQQQHHLQNKETCWQSDDILPWSSWLERLWLQYTSKQIGDVPLLLNSNQEQILWEGILRDSPASDYLLQLSGTAELAKSAWGLLKQWRVNLDHPLLTTTEDGLSFHAWASTFQNLCTSHHWLDSNSLVEVLCDKILKDEIILPQHILLSGFTEISPLNQYLLDICQEKSCRVTHSEPPHTNSSLYRVSLQDEETEIRTMARWTKAILDADPKAFIGCTIPRLEKCRDKVIRIFSEVYTPNQQYTLDYTSLPFNISAGKSLATYPIIHTAIQLLKWRPDNIPLERFSRFIRSPFIGAAETEMLQRSQLDYVLRKANSNTISLRNLLTPKPQQKSLDLANNCPALAQQLQNYLALPTYSEPLASLSTWVSRFLAELHALGWPGERSLNSHEYQIVESWLELLNQYASFESILKPQTRARALDYLVQMTSNKVFQVQSPEAPIQILGMLEATEIPFDHLWVMGLDDTAWPPVAKPNPFIPQRLQKNLNMPHATAERELLYCQLQTEQLKHTAKHVIFSHAEKNDDAELRPSPIIQSIPSLAHNALPLAANQAPALSIFKKQSTEYLLDEQAPSITSSDKIRGGANLFKLQAACPFKAFAELRLHAKTAEAPTLGLRAHERGNIIHKAMEMIWLQLKDQATLCASSHAELQQLIQHSVKHALSLCQSDAIQNKRYFELECVRIEKIITQWLESEKHRPPFKVIAIEKELSLTISQMTINLRIDRIDELENRKHIVIDYKTGQQNEVQSWFGLRPDEPQLPLYAISDPQQITGLIFAQINAENMKWVGVCDQELDITGVKTLDKIKASLGANWATQTENWQHALSQLGDQFYQGKAAVDPKDVINTCLHCDLQTFCRIHESVNDDEPTSVSHDL